MDNENVGEFYGFVTVPPRDQGSLSIRHEVSRTEIEAATVKKGEKYGVRLNDRYFGTRWWTYGSQEDIEGWRLRCWRSDAEEETWADDGSDEEDVERRKGSGDAPVTKGENPEMLVLVPDGNGEIEFEVVWSDRSFVICLECGRITSPKRRKGNQTTIPNTLCPKMNYLRSTVDSLRDRYAPVSHTSTFRSTGQITPEEFLIAGDFLVYKFPTWSWSDASHPSKRVSYLPDNKQFLVTRGVPCHRRLNEHFAGEDVAEDAIIKDGFDGNHPEDDDDGWLRTGGMGTSQAAKLGEVRTVDESGRLEEREEEEEEIPDMEDEEDDEEAIIRDPKAASSSGGSKRTYTLYIVYTPYYRTPRIYLSGYLSASEPLPPLAMMEDIAGDYKDKTVTLEDFPFFDSGLKMASVHPCKHASVMKVLLDRADAALKLRMSKIKDGKASAKDGVQGMEGLVDGLDMLKLAKEAKVAEPEFGGDGSKAKEGEDWEEIAEPGKGEADDEIAIRVDQYLVVFLKFMASVTPTIEHDFTTSA
ncbi:hypothetical protein EJ08DRAFT_663169 [Tothia fuscella]|uniref:Autophagy-related protein 3 n=1 Tax=Tothia fuscella TaxID=1048955 RepID=A0A9P4NL73_9PEZI|nr:hypothetical protein EJ08DRAFT_663169 [Tothia fuscella]